MSTLTLRVVTSDGINQNVACDSVSLWMAPDVRGRGEGSIGIRKDHIDAVIALGEGPLAAYLEGKDVFSARTKGGVAIVQQNTVTVVTPHLAG